MGTAMTIVEALSELPEGRRVLILAHPGSGTRFVRDQLVEAKLGNVALEEANMKRVQIFRAVISEKYWNHSSWTDVWHLVREPIRIVYSISMLFHQNHPGDTGRTAHMAYYGKEPSDNALRDCLWSVAELNRLADIHATRRFRLEDQPGERDPKSTHLTHGPREMNWDELTDLDSESAALLLDQTRRYGY